MIFMLDTDTLIFVIRGAKRRALPAMRRRTEKILLKCQQTKQNGDQIGLSAITIAELEFGARRAEDYEKEFSAVRKIIEPFEHYSFDAELAPHEYGIVRGDLEDRGKPIGGLDPLIAGHALSMNATLVTNNTGHYGRIPGLRIENWS